MTLPASAPTPQASRRATALVAGALLLGGSAAGAPAAMAAGCQGAPGSSAVEQYCEAIPSATGGRSQANRDKSKDGKSGSKSATLSEKTSTALASAGDDGAAVTRLADDGSVPAGGSADGDSGSGAAGGSGSGNGSGGSGASSSGASDVKGTTASGVAGVKDASGSPLQAATEAAQTGSTVGPALAWGVVGMSALGAVAAVFLRRRRGTIAPPGDDA